MVNVRAKVPAGVLALFAFVVVGCGGDAESAADPGSEAIESAAGVEQEAEGAASGIGDAVEETHRESPRTVRREAPAREAPAGSTGSTGTGGTAEAGGSSATPAPPVTRTTEPERRETAAPEAAPEPEEVPVPAVARGTHVPVALESELSTRSSSAGDVFFARVTREILADDGLILVPEGARVEGRVDESRRSAGAEEEAVLSISFHWLHVDGERYPIRATITEAEFESEARDSGTRSAAKVATGAAAGALVGQILGRDTRSTARGAAVGAAAGTAVAVATRDGHAVMRDGAQITLRLEEDLRLVAAR